MDTRGNIMKRIKILTIDDDPDILDVLDLTLSETYDISSAQNGKEGFVSVHTSVPDLIICDYMMPLMNGREFCKKLKEDILLRHIPIIMLTGKSQIQDRIGGIESGADDYIIKPFSPDELLARIKMITRRTTQSLDASPLTHLPGNTSIHDAIQKNIDSGHYFCVGYADLDKFKSYNDQYGFKKGDEVIKTAARNIIQSAHDTGGPDTFVGHIGGDDFVFISDDNIADKICERIIESFDAEIPRFYTKKDYQRGFIISKDRQGKEQHFDLIGISIGLVSNKDQPITHIDQVGEISADLKKFAKTKNRSNFIRNKRKK